MHLPFQITCFDAELSRRTTAAEWARILQMRDHPDFLNALRRYHELIPVFFSDNIILNKVVTEAWRFEILVYTLYLFDQRDPDDPRSGLTVSNLQTICARQNCASPGRVLAILGLMRIAGYLKRQKSGADGRIVHLEPSDRFVAIVEGWNQRIFRTIDAVMPDDDLAGCHARQPRFGWEMRRRGAEHLLEGWKLLDPFEEVFHFVSSDGGWMLLLHCIATSLQADGTIEPVSIDLARFGKSFGVSRSHLRRLLESAHRKGLLTAPPRNGASIWPAQHLVASFLACMASELGNYRAWALAARDDPSRPCHAPIIAQRST